ncbi:hypothetical protein C4579_04355 [Candidatus Microgenomates bacterium]|nr:MAG: hypothetical protein C4579_04355 [Candidatus Microgenomates bacterium]
MPSHIEQIIRVAITGLVISTTGCIERPSAKQLLGITRIPIGTPAAVRGIDFDILNATILDPYDRDFIAENTFTIYTPFHGLAKVTNTDPRIRVNEVTATNRLNYWGQIVVNSLFPPEPTDAAAPTPEFVPTQPVYFPFQNPHFLLMRVSEIPEDIQATSDENSLPITIRNPSGTGNLIIVPVIDSESVPDTAERLDLAFCLTANLIQAFRDGEPILNPPQEVFPPGFCSTASHSFAHSNTGTPLIQQIG